eukprot:TRINITY_DN39841_c0_g1_i1.p1 TRINITY_DN39841_c0_g1~~TRINITY_DN39841_c0_g1_i1.p1  ORF type:complete len:891 (+),score=96.54 TRINITY_DN39841_c0_g1_i1:77-2749(+)
MRRRRRRSGLFAAAAAAAFGATVVAQQPGGTEAEWSSAGVVYMTRQGVHAISLDGTRKRTYMTWTSYSFPSCVPAHGMALDSASGLLLWSCDGGHLFRMNISTNPAEVTQIKSAGTSFKQGVAVGPELHQGYYAARNGSSGWRVSRIDTQTGELLGEGLTQAAASREGGGMAVLNGTVWISWNRNGTAVVSSTAGNGSVTELKRVGTWWETLGGSWQVGHLSVYQGELYLAAVTEGESMVLLVDPADEQDPQVVMRNLTGWRSYGEPTRNADGPPQPAFAAAPGGRIAYSAGRRLVLSLENGTGAALAAATAAQAQVGPLVYGDAVFPKVSSPTEAPSASPSPLPASAEWAVCSAVNSTCVGAPRNASGALNYSDCAASCGAPSLSPMGPSASPSETPMGPSAPPSETPTAGPDAGSAAGSASPPANGSAAGSASGSAENVTAEGSETGSGSNATQGSAAGTGSLNGSAAGASGSGSAGNATSSAASGSAEGPSGSAAAGSEASSAAESAAGQGSTSAATGPPDGSAESTTGSGAAEGSEASTAASGTSDASGSAAVSAAAVPESSTGTDAGTVAIAVVVSVIGGCCIGYWLATRKADRERVRDSARIAGLEEKIRSVASGEPPAQFEQSFRLGDQAEDQSSMLGTWGVGRSPSSPERRRSAQTGVTFEEDSDDVAHASAADLRSAKAPARQARRDSDAGRTPLRSSLRKEPRRRSQPDVMSRLSMFPALLEGTSPLLAMSPTGAEDFASTSRPAQPSDWAPDYATPPEDPADGAPVFRKQQDNPPQVPRPSGPHPGGRMAQMGLNKSRVSRDLPAQLPYRRPWEAPTVDHADKIENFIAGVGIPRSPLAAAPRTRSAFGGRPGPPARRRTGGNPPPAPGDPDLSGPGWT